MAIMVPCIETFLLFVEESWPSGGEHVLLGSTG